MAAARGGRLFGPTQARDGAASADAARIYESVLAGAGDHWRRGPRSGVISFWWRARSSLKTPGIRDRVRDADNRRLQAIRFR